MAKNTPTAAATTKAAPAQPAAAPAKAPRNKSAASQPAQPAAAAPAPAAAPETPKAPKPVTPTNAATQEEIEAAVAGVLKPRKLKGEATQESLGSTNELGRPAGRPLGTTTGLPIMLAWAYAFQCNEVAPRGKKLTDPQLSQWMKNEFPGRQTGSFDRPSQQRRDYNNGRLTQGRIPTLVAHNYDDQGNPIPERTRGANGNGAAPAPEAAPAPAPAAAPAPKRAKAVAAA